jgi:hypothetical protein
LRRAAGELRILHTAELAVAAVAPVADVVVYKGAALAQLLYRPGERAMADVDLLVRPRDLRAATAALEQAGWRLRPEPTRPLGYRWHWALTFVRDGAASVDLHASPAQRMRWKVGVDGVFERATPLRLGAVEARRPCDVDAVLLAALNDAKDEHASRSFGTEDAARLIARGELDWAALVMRAREWRARVAVWVTLLRAQERFGAAVPAEVFDELRPRRARALLAALDRGGGLRMRRVRQAVLGPLLTDSPQRFTASAVGFAGIRALDLVLAAVSPSRPT